MLFTIISYRQAGITRPDTSSSDLMKFRADGYSQVAFIANLMADPPCKKFDGNIYNISDLLRYDNPLYRTSHPNCQCKFRPIGQDNKIVPENTPPTAAEPNEQPAENPEGNPETQTGNI